MAVKSGNLEQITYSIIGVEKPTSCRSYHGVHKYASAWLRGVTEATSDSTGTSSAGRVYHFDISLKRFCIATLCQTRRLVQFTVLLRECLIKIIHLILLDVVELSILVFLPSLVILTVALDYFFVVDLPDVLLLFTVVRAGHGLALLQAVREAHRFLGVVIKWASIFPTILH